MVEPFELTIAKCRMYVAEPVIEPQKLLFIIPAMVLVVQQLACVSGYSMTLSISSTAASSSLFVVTIPPSPLVMIFTG